MKYSNLSILVILREINDPRPPASVTTRGACIKDSGLRRVPNPGDLVALEEALRLKDSRGATVTVLVVGPERLDDTIRLGCAMGADRGIRIWDYGLEGWDVMAEARLFSRALNVLSPTLIFSGNRLVDRGDDPALALAAAKNGIPCISAAVALEISEDSLHAMRKSDRGARQEVASQFPCTILFEEGRTPRYPSVDDVTRSLEVPIEKWSLSDLGLPHWETGVMGSLLTSSGFSVPRPDPVRVATPDADLPAFDRIISLLSGGIKAREGRTHQLDAHSTADALWRVFGEEGLIRESAP